MTKSDTKAKPFPVEAVIQTTRYLDHKVGDQLRYTQTGEFVRVLEKHLDGKDDPYYTVKMVNSGIERQTTTHHLSAIEQNDTLSLSEYKAAVNLFVGIAGSGLPLDDFLSHLLAEEIYTQSEIDSLVEFVGLECLDNINSITPLVQEMSTGDFRLYPDLVKAHLRSFRDITDLTTHDLF
jgi:hypothetical protein